MDTRIERDGEAQVHFGQSLEEFYENMRSCCKSLRGHIEEARSDINADNAVGALDYLTEVIDQIESELPGIAEYGARQKTLGRKIIMGDYFKFSR